MNLYIYSDESGVFDKVHSKYFVFAGYIFLNKEEKEIACRKYSAVEREIKANKVPQNQSKELKASNLKNNNKRKLVNILKPFNKFSVVIELQDVYDEIFNNKKSKQRFMDFAYKLVIKRKIEELIINSKIKPSEVVSLNIYVDEHTTATNGQYELSESIQQEFVRGMYNSTFTKYMPPILPNVKSFKLKYCDSSNELMIRASDIFANKIYHLLLNNKKDEIAKIDKNYNMFLPKIK